MRKEQGQGQGRAGRRVRGRDRGRRARSPTRTSDEVDPSIRRRPARGRGRGGRRHGHRARTRRRRASHALGRLGQLRVTEISVASLAVNTRSPTILPAARRSSGRQLRGAHEHVRPGDLDPGQLGPHRDLGLRLRAADADQRRGRRRRPRRGRWRPPSPARSTVGQAARWIEPGCHHDQTSSVT